MAGAVLGGVLAVAAALGLLFGPPAAASVVLRWTERRLTLGLLRLAGRWAVLLTGWLGVPLHELSHAALCVVFRHRIDKLVLFRPDPRSGTLGYVEHTWDRRRPWQVVGAFFVGVAPLLGGAAAILGLLHLLVPGAAAFPRLVLPAGPGDAAGWSALAHGLGRALEHTVRSMFAPHSGAWRSWLFLYLALCIGSHISPSRPDLEGSAVGALAVLAVLSVTGAIAVAAGAGPRLASFAWTAGLSTGLLLFLVAAVNVPLALLVTLLARLRA